MAYKTDLIKNKRELLKSQLDDFATFQWRGHDMFEDFGCFIINDKNGSLKFYNGPGFTNQYAKAQFSPASNALLGVEFKQQTIPMKVGLYWFTIEEYQRFLECIGPYHINYITFNFDDKYGYLVKSGKIGDSTKYVIGTDGDGEKRYYTELDLSWEVLGDSCVRSNLAYEYQALATSDDTCEWNIAKYSEDYIDESKRGQIKGDMSDNSLLDTPLVFEIPCHFTSEKAMLTLEAILPETTWTTTDSTGQVHTHSMSEKVEELFKIQLQNLTVSSSGLNSVLGRYRLSHTVSNSLEKNNTAYYCQQGIFDKQSSVQAYSIEDFSIGQHEIDGLVYKVEDDSTSKETPRFLITFPNDILIGAHGRNLLTYIEEKQLPYYYDYSSHVKIEFDTGKLYWPKDWASLPISVKAIEKSPIKNFSSWKKKMFNATYNQQIFTTIININSIYYEVADGETPSDVVFFNEELNSWAVVQLENGTFNSPVEVLCKKSEVDESLHNNLELLSIRFIDGWFGEINPYYQLYLRYDSETGLIYIQKGSQDSWHLLNFQTANNNGAPLVESLKTTKYKIPGSFSLPKRNTTDWKFKLTYSGINVSFISDIQLDQAITIYSRKNVI